MYMYSWKSSIALALLIATAALYSEAAQENVAEEAEAAPAKIIALDALVAKLNKKFYAKHKATTTATKAVKKTAKKKPDSHVVPIDDETENEMLFQLPRFARGNRRSIGDGGLDPPPTLSPPAFDDVVQRLGESESVSKGGLVTRKKTNFNFHNSARWTAVHTLTVDECKNWKKLGSDSRYAGKYYNYCKTQQLYARSPVARKHKGRRPKRKSDDDVPEYMWLLGDGKNKRL